MSPEPLRIQLSRKAGFRLADASANPNGVVNCARPGKWGNPFAVIIEAGTGVWRVTCKVPPTEATSATTILLAGHQHTWKHNAVADAVRLFRLQWEQHAEDWGVPVHELLADLTGKDLACWCDDGPCHADVLLKLANPQGSAR